MKLLFVSPRYYPYIGGIEYVVKSVAERLAERGHEATVLCGEPGVDNPKEEWIDNVRVVRWPIWAPGGAYHFPKMREALERWLLDRIFARSFSKLLLNSVNKCLESI